MEQGQHRHHLRHPSPATTAARAPAINGFVDGNASEWNDGDIVIDPGTTLNGYAEENGPGEVIDNR